MSGFVWGLLGGFIAWLATAILGQPFYTFLSLRSEAARLIALYERTPILPSTFAPNRAVSLEAWQIERKRAYQECGSRLMGLAAANNWLVFLLHKFRLYPEIAANGLFMLAEFPSPDPGLQQNIISNLRLKTISL
jgi:hypothetical protein